MSQRKSEVSFEKGFVVLTTLEVYFGVAQEALHYAQYAVQNSSSQHGALR